MSKYRKQIIKKRRDLYLSYLALLKELGPIKANKIPKYKLFKMAAARPAPSFYIEGDAAQKIIRSVMSDPDERRKIERDFTAKQSEAS
jgi:hypothetical protein